MGHTVNNGVVHCGSGIPEAPRWFADGRLSFQFDGTAVTQVDYRNPAQLKGNDTVFLQRLWSGLRYFVERGGAVYKPEHLNTAIWPFGVEAEWQLAPDGACAVHRLLAVGQSIVIQLDTPANLPPDCRFQLEFYRDFGLVPADGQDYRFADSGAVRKWRDWTFDADGNALTGSFTETLAARRSEHDEMNINSLEIEHEDASGDAPAELHIAVGADFALRSRVRPLNTKYILSGTELLEPSRTYSFFVVFGETAEAARQKLDDLALNAGAHVAAQFERYLRVARNSPVLDSPYKELNDFISLAPLYHESCKVTDRPGAIRAKNTTYWVWGWDGLTSNYAALYWGDHAFIRDMLRFYEDTADPEWGIGHAFRNDMSLFSAAALPSQGMYITLLQQYAAMTGDTQEVRERFPFAKRIFERILREEAGDSGLCAGASLFPDFPMYMHETGSDISSLNNTILYCAVRSMEALAEMAGDRATRERARAVIRGIEAHYLKLFFDTERGFVVSSIDAVTMARRPSFNANAVKWENFYGAELMEPVMAQCLSFFERHIVCKAGLREIPVWSDAYDMDANQLHCWWPVTGEYYMQLMNGMNRPDLIRQWVGWVGYWTRKLTCPEGISCYVDTEEPELDRWNSAPGTWHAYSMRGWYQAAIHGVVGVGIEAGGMTFYPYAGEAMTLSGLRFRDRVYDIAMRGSGPYIAAIDANGRRYAGTHKLPMDAAEGAAERERIAVTVTRTAESGHPVYIRHAYGLELYAYAIDSERGAIRAAAEGAGICRLKLGAAHRPVVLVDGAEVDVAYDEAAGEATALLDMTLGKRVQLEIA